MPINWKEVDDRLASFCAERGELPPGSIVDADGAPSDEFMAFVVRTDLSLDWVILGEGQPHANRRAVQ